MCQFANWIPADLKTADHVTVAKLSNSKCIRCAILRLAQIKLYLFDLCYNIKLLLFYPIKILATYCKLFVTYYACT